MLQNTKRYDDMIINDKNKEKTNEYLSKIQGRATARIIDYDILVQATKEIEKHLGIPKKAMLGIEIDVDWYAQTFPRAYKYTPESTHAVIRRTPTGWKLLYAYRGETRTSGHTYILTLTDTAKKAIIESMEDF